MFSLRFVKLLMFQKSHSYQFASLVMCFSQNTRVRTSEYSDTQNSKILQLTSKRYVSYYGYLFLWSVKWNLLINIKFWTCLNFGAFCFIIMLTLFLEFSPMGQQIYISISLHGAQIHSFIRTEKLSLTRGLLTKMMTNIPL